MSLGGYLVSGVLHLFVVIYVSVDVLGLFLVI